MDKVIDGVKIVPLRIINNINGNVLHIIRNDDPNFLGFGECYCSELLYNKIKGWKKHKLQTQNLTVPSGLVKFVLFDKFLKSILLVQISDIDFAIAIWSTKFLFTFWKSLKAMKSLFFITPIS